MILTSCHADSVKFKLIIVISPGKLSSAVEMSSIQSTYQKIETDTLPEVVSFQRNTAAPVALVVS